MNYQSSLKWIIPLIFVLALFAAGMGVFYDTPGEPYPFTSLQGEQLMINNHGMYALDTVSSAAQMQANDAVALFLGLPLLAISTWLAFRGSLRGRLLLAGTLGFFLYTYMSMVFNTAYNNLYLVYLVLFSLSLFAFILAMRSFDLKTLRQQFTDRLPRKGIAILFIVTGIFLLLVWVGGRIMPTLQGQTPAMEGTTTMVIQVMDLGMIVPFTLLSGILLLRRSAWGYLLASVAVMKFLTMGLAVTIMGINMILHGVPDDPIVLGIFGTLTLINVYFAVRLLGSIRPAAASA